MHQLFVCILICQFFVLPSCLRTRVHMEDAVGVETYRSSQDFLFWGLTPERLDFKTTQLCRNAPGKKISYVETQTSGVDGLLTFLTIGIYSPKTLIVRCTASRN